MSSYTLNLDKYSELLKTVHLTKDSGKVTEVNGMIIKGYLPGASVGSICEITPSGMDRVYYAEVVGFKDKNVLMMPLNDMRGIALGSKIVLARHIATVKAGPELLGRIVDGLGRPLDSEGELENFKEVPLYSEVRNPLARNPIRQNLDVGVRAINGLLTTGQGQRIAIMAGSGVGKSVLLGMMARYTTADVNVIALIGERGREVRELKYPDRKSVV